MEEEEVKAPVEWSQKKKVVKDEMDYGPFDMGGRKQDQADEFEGKMRGMKEREEKMKKKRREKEVLMKEDEARENLKKDK